MTHCSKEVRSRIVVYFGLVRRGSPNTVMARQRAGKFPRAFSTALFALKFASIAEDPASHKVGDLKLEWQRAPYDNAKLHEFLGHWIYQDQTLTDLAKPALWGGLGVLLVGLVVAIPKDSARKRIRKHGHRLKGPELVTVRVFNRRNRSDGIGFLQQQNFTQKIFHKKAWLRLPGEIESSHILVMGDSGKGKSALIRQILLQIKHRGETAIVYDPATPADYVPYFLTPSRGDVILNPLDQRMPYWTPGD